MDGTVLVADDDRTIRTVLTQALTRAGCKVHATSSLTTLMRWVGDGLVDVLISDVMMPDGNGLYMLPKISQDRPGLPVIVISAQNTIMTAIQAAEAEAYDYLPKPFDLPDLMKRTAKALEAKAHSPVRVEEDDRPDELPLVGRTAIMQALPLTITLMAWAVLGEAVGWRRFTAIAVGLLGVMLIIRPGTSDFTIYSLYGVAAVACVTARDLITRKMSRNVPTILIVLTNSAAVMIVFGILTFPADWQAMSVQAWGLTTGAAVFIIGAYLFSILVMRIGDISFVAPFRYTGLIWALVLGYLVFGDWPDAITLFGAVIVVGSGLFMLYRETQLARGVRKQ